MVKCSGEHIHFSASRFGDGIILDGCKIAFVKASVTKGARKRTNFCSVLFFGGGGKGLRGWDDLAIREARLDFAGERVSAVSLLSVHCQK